MNASRSSTPLTLFALLLLVSSALGQVVVQDMHAADEAGNAPTDLGGGVFGYEITLDPATEFSAAGHDKLVMVYSGHDGSTGNGRTSVTSVTYNGVALTEAIEDFDNGNLVNVAIFYLDNPATDGTLRIELDSGTTVHYGFGLYAVDGLKPGVQDTGTARSNAEVAAGNHAVTFTTNEGFFVQENARNNQSFTETTDDDFLTLYTYSVDSYRAYSQYRVIDAAGDYEAPIGNSGDNFKRIVSAAFEGASAPAADLEITSITPLGSNVFELTLTGAASTGYEFYSSSTVDFSPGTLLESLNQGDPGDAGTIGGTNNSVLTTDGSGNGTVRVTLTGAPSDFVRAQSAP